MKAPEDTKLCDMCKGTVASKLCEVCDKDLCSTCSTEKSILMTGGDGQSTLANGLFKVNCCSNCKDALAASMDELADVLKETEEYKNLENRAREIIIKLAAVNTDASKPKQRNPFSISHNILSPNNYTYLGDTHRKKKSGFFRGFLK